MMQEAVESHNYYCSPSSVTALGTFSVMYMMRKMKKLQIMNNEKMMKEACGGANITHVGMWLVLHIKTKNSENGLYFYLQVGTI
jgi:hypothetical protein